MLPRITSATPAGGLRIALTFSDGVEGEVDLHDQIAGCGGVFEALEDVTFFARVAVDRDAGTVVWPNGVDLDPDVLHALVTGKPVDLGERTTA